METILKADVFFFITSVAVVLITIFAIIALAYCIRILHDISRVTRVIREQSEMAAKDITFLRSQVRRGGVRIVQGVVDVADSILYKYMRRSPRKKASPRTKKDHGKKEDK
jgi:hypothetical protein